ncbi:MAG TPA: nitroreductase family protein [Acidimicrobiia bacterium]|nr:nitroreductase family protein [Acidimicrobiia bacterium]
MSDDDLFAIVHRQRACRAFSDRLVDDADLARILDAATFAPSAENRQPWEFVVVRDDGVRAAIQQLTVRAWDGGGRAFAAKRLEPALLAEVDASMTEGRVHEAPVLVVVAADTERCLPATIASSIYPATQNLLLAATALGLASAFTTITTVFADELRALVGLPDHVLPQVVVPLGYPAKPLGPPRREPFAEHTHRDRYGSPW